MSLSVAILIDDFFPNSGGIGRSVQTQLEELSRMGHEVTLIAPDRHLQRPAGVRTIACPAIYKEGLPAHLCVLHPTERRARLISKQARFDVVHSQTERGALVLAARIARLQGIPHVHTFHTNIAGTHSTLPFAAAWGSLGYEVLVTRALGLGSKRPPRFASSFPPKTAEPDNNNFFSRMDWRSLGWIAAHADAVTSPAAYMLENIEAAVAQPIGGTVIPNASAVTIVDGAAQRREERHGIRFLSIGRLAKEKRLDVIIRAFNRARIPDAELVIVGDGDSANGWRPSPGQAFGSWAGCPTALPSPSSTLRRTRWCSAPTASTCSPWSSSRQVRPSCPCSTATTGSPLASAARLPSSWRLTCSRWRAACRSSPSPAGSPSSGPATRGWTCGWTPRTWPRRT